MTTFLERRARDITNHPCAVFWGSLLLALVATALPFVLYDFEVDFTTEAFEVRGNDIAGTELMSDALRRGPHYYDPWSRRQLDDGCGSFDCPDGGENLVNAYFKTRDDKYLTQPNIEKEGASRRYSRSGYDARRLLVDSVCSSRQVAG